MFDRDFKLQAVQMIHLHRLHDKIAMAFCGHVVAHVIAFILATTHKVSPQDLALSAVINLIPRHIFESSQLRIVLNFIFHFRYDFFHTGCHPKRLSH